MDYFVDAFKRYADFDGRARRQEYWMFVLFYLLVYLGLGIIGSLLDTMVLTALFSLAALVPSISICTRRLHDTGRTGWWQLIGLIPLIGWVVMIVFLVQDSQDDNQYGPKPVVR